MPYPSEDEGLDISTLESVQNKLDITGGNHAYFGDYGEQKGVGRATVSRAVQQEAAVEAIIEFIVSNSAN